MEARLAPPDTRPSDREKDSPDINQRERSASRYWIGSILLLGALLRLVGLGSSSLWYDEGASLYLGEYLTEFTAFFDPTQNIEPPANGLLTGLWSSLVSQVSSTGVSSACHDFLLRLLPCLFGIVNCFLVYRLTRRLYVSPWTARCAALLFAVSPFQIYYAQELRIYSETITLALLSVTFMVDALRRDRVGDWAGYVGSLAVLMYSHFFSMWIVFTLNVAFVAMSWKYGNRLWRWTAANAILMVLIAPALYMAFTFHAATQDLSIPWYPNPTWKTGLLTAKAFFAGYSPTAWAYWPLALGGLGLWLWGITRWRGATAETNLVICLTWIPIVGCVWVWGRADFSFYEHRLFIFSGVAMLIGVARGITCLGRPGIGALVALLLCMMPALSDHYRHRIHPTIEHRLGVFDKVDFRFVARILEDQWQPGDRLVYANLFSAYPMRHYFPKDQVHLGWDQTTVAKYIQLLGHEELLRNHQLMPVPHDEAIAGATRIWFLTTTGITFESQPFSEHIRRWLASFSVLDGTWESDGVKLQCYVPIPGKTAPPEFE